MNLTTDLINGLDPVEFARDGLNFEPDPWQAEILRSKRKRVLLNCSRQSGKSTTVSILAAHRAVYHRESLVLLLSRTERQSSELFSKTADHLERLGEYGKKGAKGKLSCVLENGSRIVSLPGSDKNIRGFSNVDLVVIDEAAFVSDGLYRSARPMLAVSNGQLIAMSTPFGKRGWFHEAWVDGGETWHRVKVPASECPRISREFLEEERKSLGALWFASEYECEFVDTSDQLFPYQAITRAISASVAELFQAEDEGQDSSYFYVGLDLGQVNDYSALAVIQAVGEPGVDTTSFHCRYLRRFPLGTSYPDIVKEVQDLMSRHPLRDQATLVVDATGVGRAVVDLFRATSLEFLSITITGGDGVTRHGNEIRVPKRDLVGELQVHLQNYKLKIAEGMPEVDNLIKELMSFRVMINDSGYDSYRSGSETVHDDLVIALALAAYSARDYTRPPAGEIVYCHDQYRFSDSDY